MYIYMCVWEPLFKMYVPFSTQDQVNECDGKGIIYKPCARQMGVKWETCSLL